MKRRFFLFAAPAIVAAPSLMRVSTLPLALSAATDIDLCLSDPREWSREVYRLALRKALETNRLIQEVCGITPEMLGATQTS